MQKSNGGFVATFFKVLRIVFIILLILSVVFIIAPLMLARYGIL